ncbi:PREDICTED: uncharacterized protein LOC108561910 [Nicrophorus vespilloides]|uniref:Uncharacterized protein LOC108561910 n=1 Tax=Nicrophorus vespilloides TaxID=110193 RepID=A0ABM1MLR9_NICVS|nr:PREDICTED: uncharacterized protein LOC108561910 [Nicrophorus vespilloides]
MSLVRLWREEYFYPKLVEFGNLSNVCFVVIKLLCKFKFVQVLFRPLVFRRFKNTRKMVYRCCVKWCYTRCGDDIPMRKFPPVDSPLFEQWKNATMNDSLKKMDNHRIQKIKRVCNRHFTEKYRRKPCFFKYDFPMLTENIFDFGINILDDEDRKRIFGDNAHNLDHSFSKTDEVKSEELRIVDSDRAVDKNLIYLDHSYCRTVKVESGEMSIVDNSDRAIDNSVNNLDDSHCETVKVKSEEMSVAVDTDRDEWESEEEEDESDYEFNGDLTINKEEILISRKLDGSYMSIA